MTISVHEMTDERFAELCDQYSDYFLEYTSEGELIVMQPTDYLTSARNSEISYQLQGWARLLKAGLVTDPSGGFTLPNGARLSPDAAWISNERTKAKPMCPEFVIELLSPGDRPKRTRAKMMEWISNGALLGWMIDPKTQTVTIFRLNQDPEILVQPTEIRGEGPVEGFVLNLIPVWEPQ